MAYKSYDHIPNNLDEYLSIISSDQFDQKIRTNETIRGCLNNYRRTYKKF